jgi:N-acetyl-anhydromuramyl-L-alanine amidase AmpD
MPYLTNLADVARSAGLTVVEQAGWKTRGHGAMIDVQTVTCHHTAGPATGDAPSLQVVQNGRSDLAGPLAHFVLSRSGVVYVVAAGQCWHTGATLQPWQSNAHSIGIEAEATGKDPWPEVQLDAYARLCAALCRAFGLSVSRVLGHKEVCAPVGRKPDPNFDMNEFRGRVATVLNPPADWLKMATQAEVKAAFVEALEEFFWYRYPDGRNLVDDTKQQTGSLLGLQAQLDELIAAVKASKA